MEGSFASNSDISGSSSIYLNHPLKKSS